MDNMITCRQAATAWGISERRVAILCKEGRIPGAKKDGRCWFLPANAERPKDNRIKKAYPQQTKLPLPIGISDFRKASSEYYYVDKTLMIRDLLDERPLVSLFTRPRRFGKTLNMDMLRVFFEKTDDDTSVYFQDKNIWRCGAFYQQEQGKYPVIFLTFKDVKFETWEQAFEKICSVFQDEFARHKELLNSPNCEEHEKIYFKKILSGTVSEVELTNALSRLTKMLAVHHGIAPILIIDEYDTPIQQGHTQGYYDEVVLFMRNLFSGGLKDNPYLSYGFMTGILHVAKESIFSGLNNLRINSILDNRYSEYFGFTPEEIQQMTAYYGVPEKYDEISNWYNGYLFGNSNIFNPWSVISYFCNDCQPQAFWQSTGSNEIIGEILSVADNDILTNLETLLQGESFLTHIDTSVIYPQIRSNPSSVYSFLLVAGYLKIIKKDTQFSGDYLCEVAIPNKEIAYVYRKEILTKVTQIVPASSAIAMQEALYLQDTTKLKKALQNFLLKTISYNDASSEVFYHGLILGLCAAMDNQYYVTSNRESGLGRFDIQLMPRNTNLPGVLIELKYDKKLNQQQLQQLANNALSQIEQQHYEQELLGHGVTTILKYGVAFCGKEVAIAQNTSK